MATHPPVSPEGQEVLGVEAQEVPRRAPRRRPFLNAAGDGTQWDPRREEHSPLFVPLGFLVPVSQNPSWEAFSLVSGCNGGVVIPRFASVPPFTAIGISRPESRVPQVFPPLFPRQRPDPTRGPLWSGIPSPSQRPLRGGGIMANFQS